MIGDDRRARLIGAMAEARLDMLLVYGNAWQCDYLRYATDFGIIEGQALALLRNDGHVTLYLDSPLEVDRAELDCPTAEVIHATDLIAEVDDRGKLSLIPVVDESASDESGSDDAESGE